MRWLWLGIALAACGTASEGIPQVDFTSTSPILSADESTDAGASDASTPDASIPEPDPGPLASVEEAPLAIPSSSRRVTYRPDAPFTAVLFSATAGQDIGILVDSRTAGAKPTAWITDNQFVSIVAKNTTSGSAFLRFTADRTGIYYLVIREKTLQPSAFLLTTFDFTP